MISIIKPNIPSSHFLSQGGNAEQLVLSKFGDNIRQVSNCTDRFTHQPLAKKISNRVNVTADLLSTLRNVDNVNWQVKRLLPLGAYNQAVDLVLSNAQSLSTYQDNACSLFEVGMPKSVMDEHCYKKPAYTRIIQDGTGVCDDFAKVSAAILANTEQEKPVSIVSAVAKDNGEMHTFCIAGDPRETSNVVVSDPWVIYPSAHLLSENTLVDTQQIDVMYTYARHSKVDDTDILKFCPVKEYKKQRDNYNKITISALNREMDPERSIHPNKDVWHVLESNDLNTTYVCDGAEHRNKYSMHYVDNVNLAVEEYIDQSSIRGGIFKTS